MASYCFAWDQNRLGAWGCKATTIICDGMKEDCPFYKTMSEHIQSRRVADARIATLPEWQQEAISDTYYGGDKPWMNDNGKDIDAAIQAAIEEMAHLP